MFGLGFFSKHTSERGLIVGVVAGFFFLFYIEFWQDVAWPWYCPLGGIVSIAVAWTASLLLDGRQTDYSPYTVQGQKKLFEREGRPETEDGWYTRSGRFEKASYILLGYFVACLIGLWLFESMIG